MHVTIKQRPASRQQHLGRQNCHHHTHLAIMFIGVQHDIPAKNKKVQEIKSLADAKGSDHLLLMAY
jgi:hypothetical protein